MSERVLVPNLEHVVADVVEGEAVIINVATSIYYGTRGIGGWVWERFSQGASVEQTARDAAALYDVDEVQAQSDIAAYADHLISEGLVKDGGGDPPVAVSAANPRAAYAKPELDVYRDMKDLLALDPPMPSMELKPADGSTRAA